MASSEFPNNLATNTYILHDYLEIAYIVCTGAVPATVERANNNSDINSRERVVVRLKNARHQFRQASILVVLDVEKLELITFYKKADIVKDQQAILAKFGQICKQNACKIERKNACRVLDLVKPELSRVWRLFSEAVLSSLTLQTPSGKKVMNIDTNVYLVPDAETISRHDSFGGLCETRYYLRKADLQIVTGGYLLLAIRESSWPPLNSLTDLIKAASALWKDQPETMVYLLPTGQLAKYTGGWIGTENPIDTKAHDYTTRGIEEVKHRSNWFRKVREWLGNRDDGAQSLTENASWCSVEMPVLETVEEGSAVRKAIVWKTVVWPADLTYVFQNERHVITRTSADGTSIDPLSAAQAWFLNDFAEARAAAADREALRLSHDAPLVDGHLFDDDVQFGSPQQFMSVQAQVFHPSQTVYPTPPEAVNPQTTPGVFADGAAQTPMSAQPPQPSIYQSSPLAIMTDSEAPPAHESAISNFLQNDDGDDDLFDDEDDPKLVQPSFGDEPNWDFFDRETTVLDVKPDMNFEDLDTSPTIAKTPDTNHNDRPQIQTADAERDKSMLEETLREKSTTVLAPSTTPAALSSVGATDSKPQADALDLEIVHAAGVADEVNTLPPKVRDFALTATKNPSIAPEPAESKRRRSSAYDVPNPQFVGHDHKYGPRGKYHFELKPPVAPKTDVSRPYSLTGRASSESSSSSLSQSEGELENEDIHGSPVRSWTRYEPTQIIDTPGALEQGTFENTSTDSEVEELLGLISKASGFEPFTTPLPAKRIHNHETPPIDTLDRWSMTAQVLTEQLTQSSLFGDCEILQLPRTTMLPAFDVSVDNTESGKNVPNASIGDLASIQASNSNTRAATRTMLLAPDRVRIRQADGEVSAELPIIRYWGTLNLQPLSGPKDVRALCLHPKGSNYSQGCDSFLKRMEETYSSCNMGLHRRLKLRGITETGTSSWDTTPGKRALFTLCQDIGKALALENASGCTIMYVVLPDDRLICSLEICEAFVGLFETFGQVNHAPEGDVVLQLLPSSFLIDTNTLIVRPQGQYIDLAMEVYNRIPPPESPQPAASAGAVMLETPVGRSLHFELSSKTASPSLRSGHCCHVAYCTSADRKWLVAAWSDSIGETALTMSYCLIDDNHGSQRPRIDVLRHICETSVHLMSRQKGQSWLAVAKVGIYDPDELQEWLYISQQLNDEHKFVSRVVILSVELQSRLTLQGSQAPFKQSMYGSQSNANVLSTPVSTPQANTTSPDQTMLAASVPASAQTPPDLSTDPAGEADTYLNDPLSEAWMVTFAFGLNQTQNFLEIRPALASGFLLKRVLRQDNAGSLAMLNVNLIAVPRKGGTTLAFAEREQILQDVLMQYRGLHILAVARRCVEDGDSCVPWHVATAFRGSRVLERLM